MPGTDENVAEFYDAFAPNYELAYAGGWENAIGRQAAVLDQLIREAWPDAKEILDCACGIGTQAIGLAQLSYSVTATDLSPGAISRATAEAARAGVSIAFGVADFRDLRPVAGTFDAVICCDNALPHLLEDADIEGALMQMRSKLRPGGLLIVTLRDFDRALEERTATSAPIVFPGPLRRVLVRLHDWDDALPLYDVRYLVLTERPAGWRIDEHVTRYRAITRSELERAVGAAGFEPVTWRTEQVVGGQLVLTAANGTA